MPTRELPASAADRQSLFWVQLFWVQPAWRALARPWPRLPQAADTMAMARNGEVGPTEDSTVAAAYDLITVL